MSCFGWIFVARPLKRTISRSWEPCTKLALFLLRIATCAQVIELRQGLREDLQGEGREERLSRECLLLRLRTAFRANFLFPLLWLGNLNFRSHLERKTDRERELERKRKILAERMRCTRACFSSSCDTFIQNRVRSPSIANQDLLQKRSSKGNRTMVDGIREEYLRRRIVARLLDLNAKPWRKRRSESSTIFLLSLSFSQYAILCYSRRYNRPKIIDFNLNKRYFDVSETIFASTKMSRYKFNK